MERGLEGGHTAATRERFVFAVDESVARHDKVPKDLLRANDDLPAWTWLPLTSLQATIFRWTDLLNNPSHFAGVSVDEDSEDEGYPAVLPDGVKSRIRYVEEANPEGVSSQIAVSCVECCIWLIEPFLTLNLFRFLSVSRGDLVVVRTEWRISGRWLLKDQTEHICAGARRVCEHFEKRPHSVLTIRDDAQKLLLGALACVSLLA